MYRLSARLAVLAALAASPALAEEHIVEMLNQGERSMVFAPEFLKIAVGDSVRFVVTNKGHNAESIDGMTPEGAEPFKGRMNQEFTVTFTVEGLYGYKCLPHYVMGMVGLIQVGDATPNLEAAKAVEQKGRAGEIFEALFAQVGAPPADEAAAAE